jgi:hypothetical protein
MKSKQVTSICSPTERHTRERIQQSCSFRMEHHHAICSRTRPPRGHRTTCRRLEPTGPKKDDSPICLPQCDPPQRGPSRVRRGVRVHRPEPSTVPGERLITRRNRVTHQASLNKRQGSSTTLHRGHRGGCNRHQRLNGQPCMRKHAVEQSLQTMGKVFRQ